MNKKQSHQKLSVIQVGIALAMTHYGLGFLIGTGQDMAQYGPSGALYAFSTAIGLLTLLPISGFYFKYKVPIWDLFRKRHGVLSGKIAAFLSVFWMIGVVASQILGGSAVFAYFGFSRFFSVAFMAILILSLTHLNIQRLSKVFLFFLMLSSIMIGLTLFTHKTQTSFMSVPLIFVQDLPHVSFDRIGGIFLTTVLITFIGMDFHQFVVHAQTVEKARKGIVLGFVILFFLTWLLSAALMGFLSSQNLKYSSSAFTAQVVPNMLRDAGSMLLGKVGMYLFSIPVVLVSVGSGSIVTRVIVLGCKKLFSDFSRKKYLNEVVVVIASILALLNGSVIDLVVSFYAIYLGAVLIPFIVLLFEVKRRVVIKHYIFLGAIIFGFVCSLLAFISTLFHIVSVHASLFTLLAGFLGSLIAFSFQPIHALAEEK